MTEFIEILWYWLALLLAAIGAASYAVERRVRAKRKAFLGAVNEALSIGYIIRTRASVVSDEEFEKVRPSLGRSMVDWAKGYYEHLEEIDEIAAERLSLHAPSDFLSGITATEIYSDGAKVGREYYVAYMDTMIGRLETLRSEY